ncbi:hypothetical protein F442_22934 [Phytophthora nicotianae P10297]|uniref:Uncharacterized protein n=1 Tax=Phytophthora nicotianae P10297 TaxID=1317064 RepID=W2XZH3_PHYNI|nr:hypothetical protein F442_22934 [Phytophthora nicotianae P10297]
MVEDDDISEERASDSRLPEWIYNHGVKPCTSGTNMSSTLKDGNEEHQAETSEMATDGGDRTKD